MAKDLRHTSIDQAAERATEAYLMRPSITYLECCISLMLTHLTREQVAETLRIEAALEEFG